MTRLNTHMKSIAIDVPSDSGDVHTCWTANSGFTVKLADDIADRHNTETIAAEVEETWHLAIRSIHDEADTFREQRLGVRSDSENKLNNPNMERRKDTAAAEEQIQIEARSPRRYVAASWHSHDDVIVTINSEALKNLSANSLEKEINQAISSAYGDYQHKLKEIHEKMFLRK